MNVEKERSCKKTPIRAEGSLYVTGERRGPALMLQRPARL